VDLASADEKSHQDARTLWEALLAHPELEASLEPEALGRKANDYLKRFNRYMEKRPEPESNSVLRFASAIEPAELEKAWRTVIGTFTGTLLSSADRARAVVRPLVSVGLRSVALMARPRLGGRGPGNEVKP